MDTEGSQSDLARVMLALMQVALGVACSNAPGDTGDLTLRSHAMSAEEAPQQDSVEGTVQELSRAPESSTIAPLMLARGGGAAPSCEADGPPMKLAESLTRPSPQRVLHDEERIAIERSMARSKADLPPEPAVVRNPVVEEKIRRYVAELERRSAEIGGMPHDQADAFRATLKRQIYAEGSAGL